jgi:hypothetical protein
MRDVNFKKIDNDRVPIFDECTDLLYDIAKNKADIEKYKKVQLYE